MTNDAMSLTIEEISALIERLKPLLENPFVRLAKKYGFDIENGNALLVIPTQLIRDNPAMEPFTRGVKGIRVSEHAKVTFLIDASKMDVPGAEMPCVSFHHAKHG